MNQFAGNYTNLSMQKFSSNVIERSIEKNKKCLRDFITEIINNDSLADLMKNNYGNYVIQKVLKLTNGTEKAYLVENIIKSLSKISDNKIYKKWRNIIQIHLDTNFITSELNLLDQFDKSMNIDKV